MKYYDHNIGDFDKKTRHLTRIERSIYRDLIELYYDTEQPLILDFDALCRKIIARSDEERTAVEQTLNEFFTKTPTGWYHDRCEEVIEKYHSNSSQKAIAGKASAAKRAMKKQQALNGNSTSVEKPLNGTSTNHKPITNNHKPKEERATQAKCLPADWTPSEEEISFCKTERPDLNPEVVAHCFRDYWIAVPGVKGRKKDWSATWRNWVRNEKMRAAAGTATAAWWSTDAAILAKGAEMEMKPRQGEYMKDFRWRVQEAINNGGKPPVRSSPPMTTIQKVAASKPPAGLIEDAKKQLKARTSA